MYPSLSHSVEDSKFDISFLHKKHPESIGFDLTGSFEFICKSGNLYYFQNKLVANKAADRYFGYRHVLTETVFKITQISTTCKIVLKLICYGGGRLQYGSI